jgi:hypothetical protein
MRAITPAIIFFSLAAATVAAIVHTDEQEWREYSAAHACRPVAKIHSLIDPVTGIGIDGAVTFATASGPDQTGYLCNDGVTYYR